MSGIPPIPLQALFRVTKFFLSPAMARCTSALEKSPEVSMNGSRSVFVSCASNKLAVVLRIALVGRIDGW